MDEFNDMYGLEVKPVDHDLTSMTGLIEDEVVELGNEVYEAHTIGPKDKVNTIAVIKESIDIIYITAQQLRERGVDVDAALAEVHRSNMSKSLDLFDPQLANMELIEAKKRYPDAELIPHSNKFIIKCTKTGKVVKPTTYSPANITIEMIK